jgi:hypothetical protein
VIPGVFCLFCPLAHKEKKAKFEGVVIQKQSIRLRKKISSENPVEKIQWLNVVPGAFAVPIPSFADGSNEPEGLWGQSC